MQIGDKVNYVPAAAHALDRDSRGNYPFVIGRKSRERVPGTNRFEEVVVEMQGAALDAYLRELSNSPERGNEKDKGLLLVRPCQLWSAVVTSVNEDDTVDLDIAYPRHSGVTLHYGNVPVTSSNATDLTPHTCHTV